MSWLNELVLGRLLAFVLVLARVSGLAMTAPIFGTSDVPARIRALLAVSLSVLVMPLDVIRLAEPPTSLVDFTILAVGELLLGLSLGLGVMVLFTGVQIAGQVVAQASGMQLADVLSPDMEANVPVFSQFMYLVALAVFVLMGGHRMLVEALLDTFQFMPLGEGVPADVGSALTTLASQSFSLGVRAAAPAMTAVLLATLVLGLVSRTLPQLNVMAVGFGLSALVTLGALALTLGAAAWIFQEQVEPVLDLLVGGRSSLK